MPSLNLLVVGQEKELNDFEEALEGCKRYVGPVKLFSAHKAVDAVGRLQKLIQTCGTCHAAFLSNHFTAPGKEEFSDTLRKVLKEKYADVPVVCWGNPKKGGDLNKHFHATVEFKAGGDVNGLVDMLKQVQAGQVVADYQSKGDRRKSLDRRDSLNRSDSIQRVDSRRGSFETMPSMQRSASVTRRAAAAVAGGGDEVPPALQKAPTARRKSTDSPREPPSLRAEPSMMRAMNTSGGASSMMGGGMGGGMGGMGMGMGGGMGGGGGVDAAAGMMRSMTLNSGPPAAAAAAAMPTAAAPGSGSNAELIRMLADEVVRLRKAVEEKRAREAREAEMTAAQQQLAALQAQQAALMAQMGGGGGGMPLGI